MYRLLKPLLFRMDAEKAHHLSFGLLHGAAAIPGFLSLLGQFLSFESPVLEKELFGLKFKNPVGLAAGLDKNAHWLPELKALGFGFIEVGTVTPRPQTGNPKPRLFRLPADQALINRMGFNNEGVEALARRLEKRPAGMIIGGNIGKNKDTPNEEAVKDYLVCFRRLFDRVDYFVVNVSSPNTPGLRELQEKEPLQRLLGRLQEENTGRRNPRPLLLKIAPDLSRQQTDDIIEIVRNTGIDGIIASNTSISRKGLKTSEEELAAFGPGGLSGRPLLEPSNELLAYLRQSLGPAFPLIGVGGIRDAKSAMAKMQAGADLIQVFTGLIYRGPGLVKEIKKALASQGISS